LRGTPWLDASLSVLGRGHKQVVPVFFPNLLGAQVNLYRGGDRVYFLSSALEAFRAPSAGALMKIPRERIGDQLEYLGAFQFSREIDDFTFVPPATSEECLEVQRDVLPGEIQEKSAATVLAGGAPTAAKAIPP